MSVYRFPKSKHRRKFSPRREFKNYRVNKPILRHEFVRTCVYCRMPDSQAKGQVFGVDHFKPQSIDKALKTRYANLFYCCNECNTYKSDYWPLFPSQPMVANPCDDRLADHLRFDKSTGRIEPLSPRGVFMEQLFRLNAENAPQTRLATILVIEQMGLVIAKIDKGLISANAKIAKAMDPAEVTQLVEKKSALLGKRATALFALQSHEGTLPIPPLSTRHV